MANDNAGQVERLTKMVRKMCVPHHKIETQEEADAMNAVQEALDISHRWKVGDEYFVIAFPA
jgi:hypothetical protein